MLRYCTNCQADFEFKPLDVSGPKELICPQCGNTIAKNSRHPVDHSGIDRIETGIGMAIAKVWHFAYIFYVMVAIVGIASFFFSWDKALLLATCVSVGVFLLQLITGTSSFPSGLIYLPVGAGLGYWYFQSIQGAYLGVHVVFLIRHVVRNIFFWFIGKLIKWGNSK